MYHETLPPLASREGETKMSTISSQITKKTQKTKSFNKSMQTFTIVWIGQVVSILGSSMTGFAMGVWIFQQTGSAVSFSLTLLFNMLPKAIIAPAAGVLADRFERRKIMIFTDLSAGLATAFAAILFVSGNLSVWHIYFLTIINASASAFQSPAFGAAVTQLVPKKQLGRANGMLQFGEGIGQIAAPVMAGVLIAAFGLMSILLIDIVTFLFAVSTLVLVRFPELPQSGENMKEKKGGIAELGEALKYLRSSGGLLGLILVFALVNFFIGIAEVVLTPMVLSFSTPEKLGLVMTIAGIGMLAGSIVMMIIGDKWPKVQLLFGAYALLSVGVFFAGIKPTIPLISAAIFMAFFFLPMLMSTNMAIFQTKVPLEIQGRVFGIRLFVNKLTFAIAFLTGGVLADKVFEPLMVEEGLLAEIFGGLIGVGPGRGMGLMFVLMGMLSIVTALSAFAFPRIRQIEVELPDAE
jgi:MFS family permease